MTGDALPLRSGALILSAAVRFASCLVVLLVGCGARTELNVPDTDADVPDAAPVSPEPRVVFSLFDATDSLRLYVIGADGTGFRPLNLPDDRAVRPAFTRDGLHLLYVVPGLREGDASSLVALDLRTRATRTIVRGVGLSSLAVSPDRLTVAYTAGLDLRAVGWDGANDRLLVQGPYNLGCCQWGYGSPAFAADPLTVFFATAGRFERIRVDATRRQQLLTEDFRRIIFPNVAVSPDNTRVAAAVACADGNRTLRTWAVASLPAACETGEVVTAIETAIVGNMANNPAWGESGEIVYQQSNDLFVVDARGGTARNLTASITGGAGTSTYAVYPAWAPRGVALP